MTRKPHLTAQEHAELGATLAAVRDELQARFVQVANAYPHAAPQVRHLDKALKALESARSALDSALAIEHSDAFDTRTYYPGQHGRPRLVVEHDIEAGPQ